MNKFLTKYAKELWDISYGHNCRNDYLGLKLVKFTTKPMTYITMMDVHDSVADVTLSFLPHPPHPAFRLLQQIASFLIAVRFVTTQLM